MILLENQPKRRDIDEIVLYSQGFFLIFLEIAKYRDKIRVREII